MKPQENFPNVDISEENADMLELMLQRHQTFEEAHTAAEQTSILFRVGHKNLIEASEPHLLEYELDMLDSGIAAYEAISGIMIPTERDHHNTMQVYPHIKMAYVAVNETFKRETEKLPELFRAHRPNASRVIEACAQRKHGDAVDYAIAGAALAYRLDMGASVEA